MNLKSVLLGAVFTLAIAAPALAQQTVLPVTQATGQPYPTAVNPTNPLPVTIASGSGGDVTIVAPIAPGGQVQVAPYDVNNNQANYTAGTAFNTPAGPVYSINLAPLTNAVTGSLASSLVVSASANPLVTLDVNVDSTVYAADWYVLVMNATSAASSPSAVTPKKCYQVRAGIPQWAMGYGVNGLAFATGITVLVSSTGCFTYTAVGAHAFISGDHQ